MTWGAIAKELGTSDRVLRKWRKVHDFPPGKDLDAIKQLAQALVPIHKLASTLSEGTEPK